MLDDGVRIEADLPGDGALVIKGAVVTIRCRTYLDQEVLAVEGAAQPGSGHRPGERDA
ncbi:MAG: hypothetical protein IPK07_24900 [Deltaproteobacteria bacterium]|nr:hypothetical protein [Deltaproteobacteria bacterium]